MFSLRVTAMRMSGLRRFGAIVFAAVLLAPGAQAQSPAGGAAPASMPALKALRQVPPPAPIPGAFHSAGSEPPQAFLAALRRPARQNPPRVLLARRGPVQSAPPPRRLVEIILPQKRLAQITLPPRRLPLPVRIAQSRRAPPPPVFEPMLPRQRLAAYTPLPRHAIGYAPAPAYFAEVPCPPLRAAADSLRSRRSGFTEPPLEWRAEPDLAAWRHWHEAGRRKYF